MVALAAVVGLLGAAGSAEARHVPTANHHRHEGDAQRETIDQRIAMLHWSLKITPDEETQWSTVAQVMRTNDAAMRDLIASTKAERRTSTSVSALEELKTYERFNRAHLDGLKDLVASFETLYTAMPDTQKAVADRVFAHFGREGPRSNG
jgi:hypothetical protein